jgi:ABC-type thiamin/hydroxymethylpyrimidine transport system permease subunit
MVTLRLMIVELKASLLGKGQVSMVSVICRAYMQAAQHTNVRTTAVHFVLEKAVNGLGKGQVSMVSVICRSNICRRSAAHT